MIRLTDAARQRIEKLQASYRASFSTKREELARALEQALRKAWEPEATVPLLDLVHKLAGSGAAYGFPELSRAAQTLDRVLDPLVSERRRPTEAEEALINVRFSALCGQLGESKGGLEGTLACRIGPERRALEISRLEEIPQQEHLVHILDVDLELASQLAVGLPQFGYAVRVFNRLDAFLAGFNAEPSDAIILGEAFLDTFADELGTLELGPLPLPPVLLTSPRNDFHARMEAARAGASAFFPKPLHLGALVAVLDELLMARPGQAFRVLSVGDDSRRGSSYRTALSEAGMVVSEVLNPTTIMQPLMDFSPDLILMDLNRPYLTGIEVAKVIRQLEPYRDIPMVFLGNDDAAEKRLLALDTGADDYLPKPVDAEYLVRVIRARIVRHRRLLSNISTDSLTGLLTRNAFVERLAREVSRCQRWRDPLALCVLQLERLDEIGEEHGQFEANLVLRNLARRLGGRLRSTDLVGRLGGSTFGVALVGTTAGNAKRVMDSLREGFVLRSQGSGSRVLHTDLSVGIVQYNAKSDDHGGHCEHALDLLAQAEKALSAVIGTENRLRVAGENHTDGSEQQRDQPHPGGG
jgi:diguanylate cyclase (GGDEF)-like protein